MMDRKTLARTLGFIAAGLAWTAALLTYSQTGEISVRLIAGGLFFALIPFAVRARSQQ